MNVIVVGAGPAGLRAAEVLAAAGATVEVFDAMPSAGRKFLLAGRGGLNLTHSEPLEVFLGHLRPSQPVIEGAVRRFGPQALRAWAAELGIQTFVGTSGRVFPVDMKAAPLLRAWLHRLRGAGVTFHMRHRWLGCDTAAAGVGGGPIDMKFAAPAGERTVQADAVVLALGGASWPQLGSNGAWQSVLGALGVDLAPLAPANCGFDVAGGWSEYFGSRFAGQPFKSVAMEVEGVARKGEFVATVTGIEGSLVYAFAAPLREQAAAQGEALARIDLVPGRSAAQVLAEVKHPRGSRSLSSHLKSRLGLDAIKLALLHEVLSREQINDAPALSAAIKAAPLRLSGPRPVAEAISSAGGVRLGAMDHALMLTAAPGVFCAGEMLDWEAPTGGYLLTAAMATGDAAARGVLQYLGARAQN